MQVTPRCSALTYTSRNRNARESQLLRLPAEVRQKIYEYAVGGHHVVIDRKEAIEASKRGCFYHLLYPNDRTRAGVYPDKMVNWEWPGKYNMQGRVPPLPLVCRQMHQETSLLMFELNLFSFSNGSIRSDWIKSLKPVQRRALRQITCFHAFPDASWSAMIKQLEGLQKVFRWRHGSKELEGMEVEQVRRT